MINMYTGICVHVLLSGTNRTVGLQKLASDFLTTCTYIVVLVQYTVCEYSCTHLSILFSCYYLMNLHLISFFSLTLFYNQREINKFTKV